MPFPMKVQPFDPSFTTNKVTDHVQIKPAPKSRLKRLFERQFPGVLRSNSSEKLASAAGEVEVGTICLDKMVINFIEENGDVKGKCGKSRCNCFHGNCGNSSDDEDFFVSGDPPAISSSEATDLVKGLVVCATVSERNLLADVATLVDKNKSCKRVDELRKIVADGLRSNGYDASVCKSRWEKSASIPAGEYEYIDVVFDGAISGRVIVDVDFRSQFEIARSTKGYGTVLQCLPSIFVGKEDRLQQIVAMASEAARQSLKKRGLSFPPWRKPDYMRNKWLSPYERLIVPTKSDNEVDEEETPVVDDQKPTTVIGWEPPPVKPKVVQNKPKVTGLAFMLRDKA